MPRGKASEVGDTRVAQNGYHYTKTEDGWDLTHRIIMEKRLGRKLAHNERVQFKDGNKTNLDHGNLELITVGTSNIRRRIKYLEMKIDEYTEELEALREELRGYV